MRSMSTTSMSKWRWGWPWGIVLLLAPSVFAAASHVKSDSNRSTSAGHTSHNWSVTGGITNTGDTVVGTVFWTTPASNLTSVTVCGNTATLHDSTVSVSTNISGRSYSYENVTAGACSIVASWDANVTDSRIVMHEVTGVPTSGAVDKHVCWGQNAPGTGTDALESTAVTPASDGQYVYGATSPETAGATLTIGTNETWSQGVDQTSRESEYLVQGTAAAINAKFTTSVGTDQYVTCIITVAASGGGGGGSSSGLMLLGVGN